MISKHCGVSLTSTRSYRDGYKLGEHAWKCQVCGKKFFQRIRKSVRSHASSEAAKE